MYRPDRHEATDRRVLVALYEEAAESRGTALHLRAVCKAGDRRPLCRDTASAALGRLEAAGFVERRGGERPGSKAVWWLSWTGLGKARAVARAASMAA